MTKSDRLTVEHDFLPQLEAQLRALADPAYQAFQSRLIPTLPPSVILGVRTPALRNFAKTFAKRPEAAAFLQCLPHRFYEENLLHVWPGTAAARVMARMPSASATCPAES